MRLALIPLLGALLATPAAAQGFFGPPGFPPPPPPGFAPPPPPAYGYGYGYDARPEPGTWPAAREGWQRARRAEDVARWRAANGDYEGADRARYWAERQRERARRDAYIARGGW